MFIVLQVTAVPEHLRGYLGRFLVEPTAGLFVGRVSVKVMDDLWKRATLAVGAGRVILIRSDGSNEQGFNIRSTGDSFREVIDFGGLSLIAQNVSQK